MALPVSHIHDESPQHLDESTRVSRSPLPASPLLAKVVVFELQRPACFSIWRHSATLCATRLLKCDEFSEKAVSTKERQRLRLLEDIPVLQPYLVGRHSRDRIHLAYFYPESFLSRNHPELRYVRNSSGDLYKRPLFPWWLFFNWLLLVPVWLLFTLAGLRFILVWLLFTPVRPLFPWRLLFTLLFTLEWLRVWLFFTRMWLQFAPWLPQMPVYSWHGPDDLRYKLRDHCPSCRAIEKYVHSTDHTSNDVLSAQENCPADLSLDEFVTFAHLRSGGSLQWLNILQGLRTRTLNLRRHQVHFLIFYAVSQVGPFDFNTGAWIWHRELQDPSFCITLLDELEKLLTEVGASSMDSVLMNTISLLLTRVLVSSPSEDVSDRVITHIHSVRRKTFSCVQDLSYDLAMEPANEERRNLLLEMAATCRSTFDVDHLTLPKLFHSQEDVDVLLSCSFFIRALYPACMSYS